jgi:hypothetical protein
MKIVTIDDAENVILGLQDEIRRSEESRYGQGGGFSHTCWMASRFT